MESPEPVRRRRLVPLWAIIVPAVLLVAGVTVAVALLIGRQETLVSVPNITGLDVGVARSRLAEQGLKLQRGDQRFSQTVPVDGVLEQNPPPGASVPKGSAILVVLSAGSESFPMPEVVGSPIDTARAALQAKGLVVVTEVVASDRAKNTVVSSDPAAGVTVSTADTVRLAISSGQGGSALLQPKDLSGKTFVIDPAAPPSGVTTDTAMEVQRRVNSLLMASGAQVVVTRSITDTGAGESEMARAERAKAASATAVIGLDVGRGGPGGVAVETLAALKLPSAAYLGSQQLGQALVGSLNGVSPGTRSVETSSDVVLQAAGAPGARIVLGSVSDKTDLAHFADPAWEDRVAQAIYEGVAAVYAAK